MLRGRWMSEGKFMDVRPFNPNKIANTDIDEASDTYDAIEWLVKIFPTTTAGLESPEFLPGILCHYGCVE